MHKLSPRAAITAATITLLLIGTSACAGDKSDPGNSSSPNGSPVKGGRLSIAFTSDSGCIDPPQTGFIEDRIIIRQIADTLTDQDPETLEIVPYLAESWEVNDTATEYTFRLKSGVTFSDGSALDAAAVKATFDGILELGPLATGAGRLITGLESTEVVDPQTVVLRFSVPNAAFLQATTNASLAILSPDSWDKAPEDRCVGDYIGSGPYTLNEYTPNESASVDRRSGYGWATSVAENQGEVYLDGIDFSFIAEPSVQVGSVTSGQLDIAWPRAALSEDNQGLIQAAGGHTLSREMPGVSETQIPNTTDGHVLSDLYARQALVKGIDFSGIAKAEYWEGYPVPTGIVAETTPGWVDQSEAYAYDPEGAKQLLEDNGWELDADGYYAKAGKRFTIRWLVFTNVSSESTAALVQDQLKDVGIEVEIVPLTAQDGAAVLEAGDYDIGNIASTRADADILRQIFDLTTVADSSAAKKSQDPQTAAKLSELFALQLTQVDPTQRLQTIAEIQELLVDQVVAFPLNARIQVFGLAERVNDVKITAENLTLTNDAWLSK
ncbi:MAG: ABC transporter substrate-binding protein [Bifidobacteriaceae bacterium]|jgi:peptide/nickel transport system substrate-binding protein|nr:ABC transporter substrate-binding protein [Bifidobacteriaceae bacterium]